MAIYQEFTIDQGTDATIELHLVDKNGAAKDLTGHTVQQDSRKIIVIVLEKLQHLQVLSQTSMAV